MQQNKPLLDVPSAIPALSAWNWFLLPERSQRVSPPSGSLAARLIASTFRETISKSASSNPAPWKSTRRLPTDNISKRSPHAPRHLGQGERPQHFLNSSRVRHASPRLFLFPFYLPLLAFRLPFPDLRPLASKSMVILTSSSFIRFRRNDMIGSPHFSQKEKWTREPR